MKNKLPGYFYNVTTLVGAFVSGISLVLILFLMVLDLVSPESKPYMGIIAFVVLPAFLIIGLGAMLFGAVRESRRQRLGNVPQRSLPKMDFENPHHRKVFFTILSSIVLFLFLSAFGSFQAYEKTDSDQFCGETCHTVMQPEYTAYQHSSHARVGCVKCHIGSGADWYVRSKISGSYQVYATLFNKYPRPIPTPIANLRPAQQTCEQCHWPQQFFAEKLLTNTYFLSDSANTKMTVNLSVKIGGGSSEAGQSSGIHWHMNIANQVTYAAIDTQRQVIPWVQVKRRDGSNSTYKSTETIVNDDSLKKTAEFRTMDCIDCHNRPSHIYHPPQQSVNHLMDAGWVDPTLPFAKSEAVKVLEEPYATKIGGLDSVKSSFENFYAANYPQVASAKHEQIEKAGDELRKIYDLNYFPEMNVSWKKYPNNLGHLSYPGCFRCHDGKHVDEEGKVLSKDCNTCHTILSQQIGSDTLQLALKGVEYKHPVDIGDAWKEMNCNTCHFDQ